MFRGSLLLWVHGAMQCRELKDGLTRLPIAPVLGELEAALGRHRNAVVVAPPGAGKTTAVPLTLVRAPWMSGRRMLLLAPRRLAARAAASRMASLLGEEVGETVGYRIRMESRVGPRTRIEVMTEGVLTRMLQSDPGLGDVGAVIFDEFHERSLDADLGLALCREVQGALNDSLRILVMSATLDPAPVAALLGGAPLIQCEGRSFPVETRYVDCPPSRPVERAVADTLLRSAAAREGNILAFLPGAPEIRRVARMLAAGGLGRDWDVSPLYGNLTRALQDRAIGPPSEGRSKIVLASAIAETSLTIEQIRVVVDSGLQRVPRFDPRTGMTRLVTLPVSQASADQRRGRGGRLGPGICYRLWGENGHAALAVRNRPEILETDLAGLALELALWGASPAELDWLDPPPAAAFEQGRALLTDLGAVDVHGKITPHGRSMAELPLHPRLAHMVLSASQESMGSAACEVAALLSERDPLHFDGGVRDSDLRLRMEVLNGFKTRAPISIPGCSVDHDAVRRILRAAALLQRRAGLGPRRDPHPDVGRILAWAYPDRIACRRPEGGGRYLMANGRGAVFDRPDPLSSEGWLVIPELDGERREARIFMAAPCDREHLMSQFRGRVRWQEEVGWDEQRKAVAAVRRLTLGALCLRTEPLADPDPRALSVAMVSGIRRSGIAALPWTRSSRTLQARAMLLRRLGAGGEEWPDLSDHGLASDLDGWLAPWLDAITSLKALARLDLQAALRGRLSRHQQQLLERLAPTHILVPSGGRRPIDYSAERPVLAVRLQEMFGAAETPVIAEGRLPLQLHLLSPAGRPVQVTQDLSGFWKNGYPAVRKELKGRYPKHSWPDDPLSARPTSRARPRQGEVE